MSEPTRRDDWVRALAARVIRLDSEYVARVGIDGPDAAGKTTFADELAEAVAPDRPVIRLGIDKFHRPAQDRRRRGDLSPEGYYRDSFDYPVIVAEVLRPLGSGGDLRYLPGTYDYRTERNLPLSRIDAPRGAVLIFDGVFLLRPELRGCWDLVIYLHIEPDETLRRAVSRDLDLFGSAEAVIKRYRRRYLPGQRLYRERDRPMERADLVLDMSQPQAPKALRAAYGDTTSGDTV